MPRYDIHMQIISADAYDGTKFFSWGQKRTLGVRGIQKLVNMFTIALMTPVGSDPLDLQRGTDVPNLIGSNISEFDAHDILILGVNKASQDIVSYQAGRQVPSDERLSSASVTDFILIEEGPGFAAQNFIENQVDQGLTLLLPTLQVRT